MNHGLPRRKVGVAEIRRKFNQRRLWERVQSGQLREDVLKDRHPSLPRANEPFCTRSQLVRYKDANGRTVALVHQYLRQDGTLGASGRPDPKMLRDGRTILHL